MRVMLFALCLLTLAAHAQNPAYDQQYRPQLHFSPQKNWTNDPNGLVYFDEEWHLFFQYNPFGDQWGHMSWGHAVSKDLIHWHELPVAIPEEHGVMIFTGSVVVDSKNTSSLCSANTSCLVAVYTGHKNDGTLQTQNLAYSLDQGRTWTKYAKNPVLDLHMKDFRDPSVFFHESTQQWVMAVSLPKEHKVRFYGSKNLKEWTMLSDFGPAGDVHGDWECPDLLHVPSADGKQSMWALKVGLNPGALQGGSGEQYFLGSFDGKAFTASQEAGGYGWTNYGKDDYCAISFNGRDNQTPVLMGWMSNWQYAAKLPTAPWRGQMSLPRRLTLVKDQAGLGLKQEPVTEPLSKNGRRIAWNTAGTEGAAPYELSLQFGRPKESVFGVRLYSDEAHWTEIGFDTGKKEFYIDRTKSGLNIDKNFPARTAAPLAAGRPYDLKVIVDRSSVEAYAQNGTIAMTNLIFPLSPKSTVKVFPSDGGISGELFAFQSIWSK